MELPFAASLRFYDRYGVHTIPYMPLVMAVDDLMRASLDVWLWPLRFSRPAPRYTVAG